MGLLSGGILFNVSLLFLIYIIGLAAYRLYISPLAKFPGPKLAALTLWYEAYYDIVKGGKYTFKLKELHDEYGKQACVRPCESVECLCVHQGPIIRISPYELHINDPDFCDELYVASAVRRTHKYPWALRMFGSATSTFGTPEHELHRTRRAALSPFFSKLSVQRLESTVQDVVEKLVTRIDALKGTSTVVNLVDAFAAMTGDVIYQYAFDKCHNFVDDPDFAPWWHKSIMDISKNGYIIVHFAWLEPLLKSFPLWLTKLVNPGLMPLIELQGSLSQQVTGMKANLAQGNHISSQRTIFQEILMNEQLSPQEKETEHLVTEGQAVIGAGSGTTAHALAILAFHLLDNPEILARLRAELGLVTWDAEKRVRWQQLEQLPYLTAVITEGLRLSYGSSHRLARISPDVALRFKDWVIPKGTPVGMTSVLVHNNSAIFPDPQRFHPERWLGISAAHLKRYFFSFGRGSRSCLGIK